MDGKRANQTSSTEARGSPLANLLRPISSGISPLQSPLAYGRLQSPSSNLLRLMGDFNLQAPQPYGRLESPSSNLLRLMGSSIPRSPISSDLWETPISNLPCLMGDSNLQSPSPYGRLQSPLAYLPWLSPLQSPLAHGRLQSPISAGIWTERAQSDNLWLMGDFNLLWHISSGIYSLAFLLWPISTGQSLLIYLLWLAGDFNPLWLVGHSTLLWHISPGTSPLAHLLWPISSGLRETSISNLLWNLDKTRANQPPPISDLLRRRNEWRHKLPRMRAVFVTFAETLPVTHGLLIINDSPPNNQPLFLKCSETGHPSYPTLSDASLFNTCGHLASCSSADTYQPPTTNQSHFVKSAEASQPAYQVLAEGGLCNMCGYPATNQQTNQPVLAKCAEKRNAANSGVPPLLLTPELILTDQQPTEQPPFEKCAENKQPAYPTLSEGGLCNMCEYPAAHSLADTCQPPTTNHQTNFTL